LTKKPMRLSPKGSSTSNDMAWRLFKADLELDTPLELIPYMGGNETADFLWSGLIPIVCISRRVFDLLNQNKVTGWKTYPVKVFNWKQEVLSSYFGFAIKSWAGAEDINRSQIITKLPPTPEGKPYRVYKGIYFDEKLWDGSDIFRINGAIIAVTNKVQQIFKRDKVTNIRFEPLSEVERTSAMYEVRGIQREEIKE